MNTARAALGGTGIQTAALAFGGNSTPQGITESWNGTSWTTLPATLNTARLSLNGGQSGTQTAALAFGGAVGPSSSGATESWNGSSWTTVTSMTTARQSLAHGGTQTAGIGSGGYTTAATNATESFIGLATKTITVS